jgi:hypothetical protein
MICDIGDLRPGTPARALAVNVRSAPATWALPRNHVHFANMFGSPDKGDKWNRHCRHGNSASHSRRSSPLRAFCNVQQLASKVVSNVENLALVGK